MVKPLHAAWRAQRRAGGTVGEARHDASAQANRGRQGLLVAMDSQRPSLAEAVADRRPRWEILDTGITVKLYPSCAATHPTLDALLDLRRAEGLSAAMSIASTSRSMRSRRRC